MSLDLSALLGIGERGTEVQEKTANTMGGRERPVAESTPREWRPGD